MSLMEWIVKLPALRMSPSQFQDLPECHYTTLPTFPKAGQRHRRLQPVEQQSSARKRWLIVEVVEVEKGGERASRLKWYRPIITVRGAP